MWVGINTTLALARCVSALLVRSSQANEIFGK
jgi:hypothetical protein